MLGMLFAKMIKDPAYRSRWTERLGFVSSSVTPADIWFHAVSAGEMIAITPVIQAVASIYPELRLIVTTTTPTGAAQAARVCNDQIVHFYAPYDFRGAISRFVSKQRPKLLFLVETELWPNLLHHLATRDIPVYLLNARLSANSAKKYALVGSLTEQMLRRITGVASQYQDTADRLIDLGLHPKKSHVVGTVKFDVSVPPESVRETSVLKQNWVSNRPTWIAVSTHHPEEDLALRAHLKLKEQINDPLLIVCPRHPNRSNDIVSLCKKRDLTVATLSETPQDVDVLVIDRMGRVIPVLGMGDVAFVGGSLQGTGGHNPIEPAIQRLPILMGPDRHNFEEVCRRFEEAGCLRLIRNANELAQSVGEFINDSEYRIAQGEVAAKVVEENRGAFDRLMRYIDDVLIAAKIFEVDTDEVSTLS